MIIHAHIKSCLFILPSPPFSKTCGPAPCGSDRIGPAFSPVISKNIMGLLCWTSSKRQMVGENTEKSVNMGPIGRLDGGWKNGIFSSISLGWVRKSVGAEFGMRVRRVTRWTFICQSPVHWNGTPFAPVATRSCLSVLLDGWWHWPELLARGRHRLCMPISLLFFHANLLCRLGFSCEVISVFL